MADRDIPSVPVTTLAGLTSLSDLLSELPLAESTQSSANKSLLFHPRVAEEANNLLQSRDPTLIQPLLQAIQQTNSDDIELKDVYKDSQSRLLPTDAPILLQAIHSYDNNVFNHQRQTQNVSNFSPSTNHTQQQYVANQNYQQQQQQPVINKNFPHSQNNSAHIDAFMQQPAAASSQIPNYVHQSNVNSNQSSQFGGYENQMGVNPMFMQQQQQNVTNFQQSTNNQQNILYQHQNNSLDWSSQQQQQQSHLSPDTVRDYTKNENLLNDMSKSPMLSSTSCMYQNNQFNQSQTQQASQNHMVQNILHTPSTSGNVEAQKVAPRNNEYLQQQQQQRPSPAQASTAPETSQINNMQNQNKFVQKSSSSNSGLTAAAVIHNTPPPKSHQITTTSSTPHVNNFNPARTNMLEALKNSSTLIQPTTTTNDTASKQQPQPQQPNSSSNNAQQAKKRQNSK